MKKNLFNKFGLLLPVILIWSALIKETSAATVPLGEFIESECIFKIPKWVKRQVECGFITVPAFHGQPERATFELPVAVFRSNAEIVKSDPLIYLHGGPGDSLFPTQVLTIYGGLNLMAGNRDIVMFDQRGASAAKPEFICPKFNEFLRGYRGAIDKSYIATGRKIFADCLRQLQDDVELDFRAFNSLEHAADVEAIRQALDIKKWNIFGSSYGSKLGQVMLRQYPETIRSIIIGSIVPLAGITPLGQQDSFVAALGNSFKACAADTVCDEAYPNLEQVFEQTVQELEANPLVLETTTPEKSLIVDGGRFVTAIFDLYSSGTFIPSIPKIIYAASDRDESFLRGVFGVPAPDTAAESNQEKAAESAPQYNPTLRDSVLTSYMCNEEVTFIRQEKFTQEIYDYEPISEFYRAKAAYSPALYDYCQLLNINQPVAPTLNEPVESEIPALIMNGGLDPITGEENALEVAAKLSNSQVVLFPSGTHGISIANRCATGIANAFLNNPSQTVNTSCSSTFKIGFTTDKITELKSFTFKAAGFRSVRPLNWVETQPGTFVRYFPRQVILSETFIRGKEQDALNAISNAGGNEAQQTFEPSQIDTLQANGLNWTFYKLVRDSGVINYIATAPHQEKTFIVLLTLTDVPNLHQYYYQEAFLPAIEQFEIIEE